jgi:trimeric autotransporter adhesin
VPYGLPANQQTQILVTHGVNQSVAQTVTIADTLPAIFTANSSGTGQGAITNASGAVVDSGNPAHAGDTLVIYCTGLGATMPSVALGVASPAPPAIITSPVSVTIGGVPATVVLQGLSPGSVGVYQLNAVVPAGVPAGDAPSHSVKQQY